MVKNIISSEADILMRYKILIKPQIKYCIQAFTPVSRHGNWNVNRLIGLVGRVFANGSGDLGSIPGRIIPKTLKMVPDTCLLITRQYKVHIKGKVEQSRERSSGLSYTSV